MTIQSGPGPVTIVDCQWILSLNMQFKHAVKQKTSFWDEFHLDHRGVDGARFWLHHQSSRD